MALQLLDKLSTNKFNEDKLIFFIFFITSINRRNFWVGLEQFL